MRLLKAVIALVVGVLVGLIFGKQLVDYIQTPLRDALRGHYSEVEDRVFRQWLERRTEYRSDRCDRDNTLAVLRLQKMSA